MLVADVVVADASGSVLQHLSRYLFIQRHRQFRALYDAVSLRSAPESLSVRLAIQNPSVTSRKLLRASASMAASSLAAAAAAESIVTAMSLDVPLSALKRWLGVKMTLKEVAVTLAGRRAE